MRANGRAKTEAPTFGNHTQASHPIPIHLSERDVHRARASHWLRTGTLTHCHCFRNAGRPLPNVPALKFSYSPESARGDKFLALSYFVAPQRAQLCPAWPSVHNGSLLIILLISCPVSEPVGSSEQSTQVVRSWVASQQVTGWFEPCHPLSRRIVRAKCSQECQEIINKASKAVRCVGAASMAAALLLTSATQATAEDLHVSTGSMCGDLALVSESDMILKLEPGQNAFEEGTTGPFVMGGMSMKNFEPARYAGRWFEVASLKLGFSGQGQEDCHCTQGVYTFDEENRAIKVDTFCVHGSPTGYITGIRGRVQCVADADLAKLQTDVERMQMIQQKCFLRFPSIPFIPKQPYNVINTDYENYALVSGSKDTSFVQIYSRTPNPGQEFIDKYKRELGDLGFNAGLIKDTPQDCEVMSMEALETMMARPGMEEAMTNRFPPLELASSGLELNPFTSLFDTLKKLVQLYFK